MSSILKEIIVLVLFLIAIFLVLAIVFYSYMPVSVVVPEDVQAYVTPSEIAEKAEEDIVQYEAQNVSFELTNSDLNSYKNSGNYKTGKANPFLPYYENTYNQDEDSADLYVKEELNMGTKVESENTTNSTTDPDDPSGETPQTNTTQNVEENRTVFDTKIK